MEITKVTEIERWPLDEDVTAFSTTRHGGYSEGEYGEFNFNPWTGDNPEHVAMNRRLLVRQLHLLDASHIILPHQVHGTESLQITRDFFDLTQEAQAERLEGIDVVMTDVPGVCIGVSTADCVPILLYDKEHHTAAAVHAGWRGTRARIVQKAISDMRGAYGSKPEALKALIGPCIHRHDYQVGYDVWQQFHNAGFDMKLISMPDPPTGEQSAPPENRKYTLDISLCNTLQMEEMGINANHIQNTMRNSFGSANTYFSARRQGINCGRTYTAILL